MMLLIESADLAIPTKFSITTNGNNFDCSWTSSYSVELERIQADGSYLNVYSGAR